MQKKCLYLIKIWSIIDFTNSRIIKNQAPHTIVKFK